MSREVEKCPILHVRPKFDVFTLYDKLQTFSDHFFVRPTLFAGYSRQEVNI